MLHSTGTPPTRLTQAQHTWGRVTCRICNVLKSYDHERATFHDDAHCPDAAEALSQWLFGCS
eukprot:5429-Heterococcus_DN1.PRE.2